MTDFPWTDPEDTGYEVEPFDDRNDLAPPGDEHDCSGGEEPPEVDE